jgi:hypothetical protein
LGCFIGVQEYSEPCREGGAERAEPSSGVFGKAPVPVLPGGSSSHVSRAGATPTCHGEVLQTSADCLDLQCESGQASAVFAGCVHMVARKGRGPQTAGKARSDRTPPLPREGQSARRMLTDGVGKAAVVGAGTQPSHQPRGGADSQVPGPSGTGRSARGTG